MELDSFKQLLLRKVDGNKNLFSLIKNIETENLVSHVIEALEKMASPTDQTGKKANRAVVAYGQDLGRSDVAQIRDAMGHHVSHYRSALKAMNATPPEDKIGRTKLRQVADKHLNHLIPLMHFAAKAGYHSNDGEGNKKLALDYVHLPAWESNYTTLDRHGPDSTCKDCQAGDSDHIRRNMGKFRHDTQKLTRRPASNAKQWSAQNPEARGVRDYHYLEMAPHPGHSHVSKSPHLGGYPWEEVRIGSPSELDAGHGFLHLEDVPDKKEYAPHPFDEHPVYKAQDVQDSYLSDKRAEELAQQMRDWKSGPHHKEWLAAQRAAATQDPEGYRSRGTTKPSPFWDGLPLTPQLEHVNHHERQPTLAEVQADRSAAADDDAGAGVAPTVRRAADNQNSTPPAQNESAAPPARSAMEEAYQLYLKAPPSVQKILAANPQFSAYLKNKGNG